MSDQQRFENIDLRGSEFRSANLTGAVFDDVDLSRAKFFNVNLRGASFGAIDFGGASFSCMNTGEDRPRKPAVFENFEFDDCTFRNGWFRNTRINDCDLTGMTIDGVRVSDMIHVYRKTSSGS